jgi:hypothetical protein
VVLVVLVVVPVVTTRKLEEQRPLIKERPEARDQRPVMDALAAAVGQQRQALMDRQRLVVLVVTAPPQA